MKPFVLRRLKRDVLQDLPKKTNHREMCAMSNRQNMLYKNLIAGFAAKDGTVRISTFINKIFAKRDEKCVTEAGLTVTYFRPLSSLWHTDYTNGMVVKTDNVVSSIPTEDNI